MRDKTLLHISTGMGIAGWSLLFRKGPLKDWFLVYLFKTLLSTLTDLPVANKKIVKYPVRYFPKAFNTNIVFDYVLFPLLCVVYSQFTNKWKPLKTILSVFILSAPMTVIHYWLAKNTQLIKYSRRWSWFHTLSLLTATFWLSRAFIASIRFLSKKRNHLQTIND